MVFFLCIFLVNWDAFGNLFSFQLMVFSMFPLGWFWFWISSLIYKYTLAQSHATFFFQAPDLWEEVKKRKLLDKSDFLVIFSLFLLRYSLLLFHMVFSWLSCNSLIEKKSSVIAFLDFFLAWSLCSIFFYLFYIFSRVLFFHLFSDQLGHSVFLTVVYDRVTWKRGK